MAKKEYIEKKVLKVLLDEYEPNEEYEHEHELLLDIRLDIINMPAADVVEVVRCGECKHYGWEQEPNHGRTERFCKLHKGLALVNRDTFCSYGERKDGAE